MENLFYFLLLLEGSQQLAMNDCFESVSNPEALKDNLKPDRPNKYLISLAMKTGM